VIKVNHWTEKLNWKLRPICISNGDGPKAKGGLWTSPVGSRHSWRHWCRSEHFRIDELKHRVQLVIDETDLIVVDNEADLTRLHFKARYPNLPLISSYPDYEKITKTHTGIWLTTEGQWRTRLIFPCNLYGWDCETILILRDEAIIRWQQVT